MDFLAEAFLEKINAKLAAFRPRPAKGEDEAENSIYNRGPGAKKSDTEGSGLYYSQLQNELKRFYSANPTLKLKACREIAHLSFYGGDVVQNGLANDQKPIDMLLNILRNPTEPFSMRLQCIQTLGVLCRGNKVLQEQLLLRGTTQILVDTLDETNPELRQWSTHALLFLMVRTSDSHQDLLQTPAFQDSLKRISGDDWSSWTHNEAEELLKLCTLL